MTESARQLLVEAPEDLLPAQLDGECSRCGEAISAADLIGVDACGEWWCVACCEAGR